MKILIVEDEPELGSSVQIFLKDQGYIAKWTSNLKDALEQTDLNNFDCILLDIGLPDGNGLSLLKELQANHKTDGVIILSAKNSMDDKIAGLNLGADDYLPKPFHFAELNARIAAVIRRRQFNGNTVVQAGDLTVNTDSRQVSYLQTPVELTPKEFDLLLYLCVNRNKVISKNAIAEHLIGDYPDGYGSCDFIYAHIKNLKKKLQSAGCPDMIRSVYGLGYKFEC